VIADDLTDDGNALRLVATHHHTIRYCPQRGQWLRWDSHRWAWDEAGSIHELARGVVRDMPRDTKEHYAWRHNSLSAQRLSAMVRMARTDPRVVVNLGDLDAAPYELNTPGGVVNLATGRLHEPDPLALHTRSTTVAPDFDGAAPAWHKFLADTFAGDPAVTTYVQRLVGVSLLGIVLEQILPFAFGAGANGKTTLLGAIQRLIGIGELGYSISAPADILLASAAQGHPTDVARLSGARLVVTSEIEDSQRFAEARIKQLTGRDTLTGRFMRQDFFSFTPTHTLWLLANHQPQVRSGGPAFWRRIRMLPFLHTVPVGARDPKLEDTLVEEEGPAILAWCIAGARDYLDHGLDMPDAVAEATEAYELDQDTVARFVSDVCQTGAPGRPDMRVTVKQLRSEYESWCHSEGEEPMNPKVFTQTLRSRYGVISERSSNTRWYTGIRVTDDTTEQERLGW